MSLLHSLRRVQLTLMEPFSLEGGSSGARPLPQVWCPISLRLSIAQLKAFINSPRLGSANTCQKFGSTWSS